MEAIVIEWIALSVTVVGSTAASVVYLSRQIDSKINTSDYDRRHEQLMERMRRLELWASKKSYTPDDGV